MTTRQAATAVNRFGLGARAGELTQVGSDPRGWLLAQLGLPVGLPGDLLARRVFPESANLTPLAGLV